MEIRRGGNVPEQQNTDIHL